MVAWGPDTEVLDMLGGGLRGDVRQVRVEQRMAVGRLSGRSRASLDWELHLLHELAGAGLRVPSVIPTASGARRNDHMVITEWIPARARHRRRRCPPGPLPAPHARADGRLVAAARLRVRPASS